MHLSIAVCLALASCRASHAGLTQYTNKLTWINVASPSTDIGFEEYPEGTTITSQYSALGVQFSDGDDHIFDSGFYFPSDGKGLIGSFGTFGLDRPITVDFSGPRFAVAVEFPGAVWFTLYHQGQLVGQSGLFANGISGAFAGIVSTVPFDRVVLDNDSTMAIDSLYFGAAVPGPNAIGVFGLFFARRRRRRR